ncbi:C1 family peptidase [Leptospira santarosai]|uniref:C1 family peptidase n=1 Tax=Leptospira santarosai TaxID=28183 RepID=UPI000773CC6E|nr:C1 family peptidase [Leptospira santarosai]
MKIEIYADMRNTLPLITDQGVHDSCLAHATSSAHTHERKDGLPFSVEYLYYFSKKNRNIGGLSFSNVSDTLMTRGQPLKKDCPEIEIGALAKVDDTALMRIGTLKTKDNQIYSNVNLVENFIKQGKSVIAGIFLTKSFYYPAAPWIIETGPKNYGLHAILIVGLGSLEQKKLFLIRNSWGEQWADKGYAWVSASFLSDHLSQFMVLNHEKGNV